MFGFSRIVRLAEIISIGIQAEAEMQGTELTPRDGQITTAATTTLITAAAGKVLLLKRAAYSVDVDQANVNGTFHFIIVDSGDNSRKFGGAWNPKTGAIYGGNVSPDFLQSGTAKTIKILTPTSFSNKLDWEVLFQEVDE